MSQGKKYDEGKAQLDLIPAEAEEQIAKVLTEGLKKYGRANWANGISYSRLFAAAKRHMNKFNKGIDNDEETGLSHIAHAATNLCMLLWMMENKPEQDDRWVKSLNKESNKSNSITTILDSSNLIINPCTGDSYSYIQGHTLGDTRSKNSDTGCLCQKIKIP